MKFKKTVLIVCVFVLAIWACVPRPAVVPVKVKVEPGPEEKLFISAEKMIQQGEYDNALAIYEEYLSTYPKRPAAEAALMNMVPQSSRAFFALSISFIEDRKV